MEFLHLSTYLEQHLFTSYFHRATHLFTSPPVGEVDAQRRVRGKV
jgi:hypothetical protein